MYNTLQFSTSISQHRAKIHKTHHIIAFLKPMWQVNCQLLREVADSLWKQTEIATPNISCQIYLQQLPIDHHAISIYNIIICQRQQKTILSSNMSDIP